MSLRPLFVPFFFSSFFLAQEQKPAERFSPWRECLTQTRGSDQMELSQGCPLDCDTCMWVRVFHCHKYCERKNRMQSNNEQNVVLVFFLLSLSFKMHLHTEYTAKADLILESSGKKTSYFQVHFVCQATRHQLSGPTLGRCCVCGGFGAARYSTGRSTTVGRRKKWPSSHLFPLFDSNRFENTLT